MKTIQHTNPDRNQRTAQVMLALIASCLYATAHATPVLFEPCDQKTVTVRKASPVKGKPSAILARVVVKSQLAPKVECNEDLELFDSELPTYGVDPLEFDPYATYTPIDYYGTDEPSSRPKGPPALYTMHWPLFVGGVHRIYLQPPYVQPPSVQSLPVPEPTSWLVLLIGLATLLLVSRRQS